MKYVTLLQDRQILCSKIAPLDHKISLKKSFTKHNLSFKTLGDYFVIKEGYFAAQNLTVQMVSCRQEHGSMVSIHQAMLKIGHLLHKITLFQSQRNSTVLIYLYKGFPDRNFRTSIKLLTISCSCKRCNNRT